MKPVRLYTFLAITLSVGVLYQYCSAETIRLSAYKDWTAYTDQERDSLRNRWTEDKVTQVVSAIRNNLPMPGFVNRLELTKAELERKERLKEFGYDTEEEYDYLHYDLRGIQLVEQDIKSAKLPYVHLEGAHIVLSNLQEVNLDESFLQYVVIDSCNLTGASLTRANLNHATMDSIVLTYASLDNVDMRDAFLIYSNLQGANFSEADLENSSLHKCDLRGAILYGANLRNAALTSVDLKNASLVSAILQSTDLEEARLDSTFLLNVNLGVAKNIRYVTWVDTLEKRFVIGEELFLETPEDFRNAEITYLDLKTLYDRELMPGIAREFHYRENEVETKRLLADNPLLGFLRLLFLKWPFGYGSKADRLLPYSVAVVFIFALFYAIQTILAKSFRWSSSGLTATQYGGVIREELLPWNHGKLLLDCLYFSILSFATFGYGAVKPRQWLELFRFEHVEFRPVRWSRVFVGIEAAIGIYIFALLVVELFGKKRLI
ncbi:MAG: hypothetical protein GY839_14115 [candidate division Zixibacteria bacterium]|nr:hypothetical protein [candidate division Zixibacteria bacterium]